jgi:hypothetical protein
MSPISRSLKKRCWVLKEGDKVGAVMVVGTGIAGIYASLEMWMN